jgi:hypothetical protein
MRRLPFVRENETLQRAVIDSIQQARDLQRKFINDRVAVLISLHRDESVTIANDVEIDVS